MPTVREKGSDPKMKESFTRAEVLEIIAAAISAYSEWSFDEEEGEWKDKAYLWLYFWFENKACLDDPPWKDGKHMGDCTKACFSCSRCQYENEMLDATIMLEAYEKRQACNTRPSEWEYPKHRNRLLLGEFNRRE